jgi:hypothetical protein
MIKTISVQGYKFRVDFDYNPPEDTTWGYQGHSESVEINDVWSPKGNILEEWARDMLQNDLEVACLEAVAIEQEEAQMSSENAKMRAWEARQEFKFENWD